MRKIFHFNHGTGDHNPRLIYFISKHSVPSQNLIVWEPLHDMHATDCCERRQGKNKRVTLMPCWFRGWSERQCTRSSWLGLRQRHLLQCCQQPMLLEWTLSISAVCSRFHPYSSKSSAQLFISMLILRNTMVNYGCTKGGCIFWISDIFHTVSHASDTNFLDGSMFRVMWKWFSLSPLANSDWKRCKWMIRRTMVGVHHIGL